MGPPISPITGDTLAWTLPELGEVANAIGVTVTFRALADGHDGAYQPQGRRITINDRPSVNQQAAALVHELAHALVDLDHHEDDPDLDYATEELVAESIAHVVCACLGLDTSANSIPYLAFWSEHTKSDAFERIAALVDRLARRLRRRAPTGKRRDLRRGVGDREPLAGSARRPNRGRGAWGWGLSLRSMPAHRAQSATPPAP